MSAPRDTDEAPSTRDVIVDDEEDLMLSRGFEGFSFQDVAGRVGIRKASIYHHFPSKEDLGVAILERSRERAVRHRSRNGGDPMARSEAQFRFFERLLAEGDRVCIGGSLAVGFDRLPERMRDLLARMTMERQQALAEALAEGQRRGLVRQDADPADQAALAAATLQGARQMARVLKRPEHFHAAVRRLRAALLAVPARPDA